MTTVKITELTDIGANLATSTVVPVVNMAGTPTTQKTNIGNIANLILEGAGTDYPEASVALLAQTVSNAAQPNITSTGTLTTLAVSGNASVNGNLTSNGTAYLGNISTTGSATITTLIVGTTANLGAVGNVKITGGTSGQILSTDGAGNLSWVSDANGGSYGNSNVATYLASYGSNTITTTGNVSVGNIIGNGQALTGIAGANVSGFVANANVANTALAVAGANVSGFVANANVANTAFAVAAANVSGLGNIATINLTGSTSNVLYGNGVFAPEAGGGNVSELVNGNNSFVLDSAGNVVFEGTPSGNAVDRGLVWDYGANANGVNSQILQDLNGLTVRAWTENAGNYIAPVNIITGQDANTNTWRFDGQGNLTVPSGSINSISDGGDLRAYITLNPNLGFAKLAGRGAPANVSYTTADWTSATYTGTQIDFVDSPQLVNFFNTSRFNVGVNQTISINGGEPVPFTGYTSSVGNAVIVYTSVTADPDPTTVTSINFYYQLESYANIDYDDGTLNVNATGLTINIDNDQTEGPDIFIRSGDDITLQAKDMSLGSEREGGDINLNAGDGADDDGTGNTASTGGDIIIDAGRGGDGNSSSGSSGGFTQITGGRGGTAGVTNLAGDGGYVQIAGGDGGFNNSNTALGASGGDVNIYGGDTTREGFNGASVNLTSGAGGANAFAGSVNISTPSSDSGPGGLWQFDGAGILTLPDGAIIDTIGNNFEVRAVENVNFEANAVVNIYTDGSNNAYQWQFGDDGLITLPGGNTKIGTQYGSEAILASNVAFGIVSQGTAGMTVLQWTDDVSNTSQFSAVYINDSSANVGDIQIRTGAVGNANIWKFGNDGNLTLPSNTFAVNYANGTQVSLGGGANTGNVTFDDVTVQGVNGLNLSAGADFTANLAYLQVRAGDVASHIHLDTGNNSAYDLIVGDDQNYVQVSSTGNILLSAYDSNTSQYTWTLDYNGNLILAGGNSVIQSIANSSLDPTLPNVSTMVLTPDANYNSQVLVLDPTAPGHIHLRAYAFSNIDEPAANIFLGGEDTAFEVTSGPNNEVRVHSGGNTWSFDNAGNLTLPTGGQIIVSGGLVSSGASPAPTINGFSITNSVGISGTGNIAGNNISATGNVTAQGVGTNLVRRANTISGSNTVVTLDNLNAYVGGTPKRLYIGAATSNMTMAGQSQTMSTGALAVSSWINVPIVTGTGNGFAMSGAITNDGDTAVLNVTDQGAGSGTWRVTGMIANTSANLYSVSIERLA